MTKRLDHLERAGLVERRPGPIDHRGKLIALTDAGKRVIGCTVISLAQRVSHTMQSCI